MTQHIDSTTSSPASTDLDAGAPENYRSIKIVEALPLADFCSQGGEKLLMAMAGVTIVRIGTTDNADIEGGGFVIDYMPRDGKETRRVVFAFNENGMWVEWEGNLASEP